MVIGESAEVALSTNPENVEKLTPRYASLVFFNSFRHSQGVPTMQRNIFNYVHIIRPKWEITLEDKPKILEVSQNMILSFLYGTHGRKEGVSLHVSSKGTHKDRVNIEIAHELAEMEEQFNYYNEKSDPEKKRELIKKIADVIIDKDLEFLSKEQGRNKIPHNSRKPFMDSWLSYIVHFGLNGNSTGVPELDEMYKDIRAFITRPGVEKSQELTEVLKIYRKKHPGVKINLNP